MQIFAKEDKKKYSTGQMLLAALSGGIVVLAVAAIVLWMILGPYALALGEAWGIVQTRFVGEYNPDEVIDAALEGMVTGTGDRWSYYLNEADYAAQNERRENSFVGIGVSVTEGKEGGILLTELYENAPAQQAGLQVGETIVAVDGVSLLDKTLDDGVSLIRGDVGKTLTLTVRATDGNEREVELTLTQVENVSVTCELLENKIGYVRVRNFYSHSAEQFQTAVEKLQEQGAVALVFDMRNNGGGYVDELTKMLDYLLPEGPIFQSETKSGRVTITYSDENCVELPMATLVNGDTYSAAEFFASQLQESVGAVIVGEKTSGKGYSQQAIELTNGGALNISTGRYRTGGGVSLVGTGVSLDKEVILEEEKLTAFLQGTLSRDEDDQLLAAVELLQEKMSR